MFNIYKTETGRLYCTQEDLDLNLHKEMQFITTSEDYLSPADWQFDEEDNVVSVVKNPVQLRIYPKFSQQLDLLWHDIEQGLFGEQAKTGGFYQAILAIKQEFPKTDK